MDIREWCSYMAVCDIRTKQEKAKSVWTNGMFISFSCVSVHVLSWDSNSGVLGHGGMIQAPWLLIVVRNMDATIVPFTAPNHQILKNGTSPIYRWISPFKPPFTLAISHMFLIFSRDYWLITEHFKSPESTNLQIFHQKTTINNHQGAVVFL